MQPQALLVAKLTALAGKLNALAANAAKLNEPTSCDLAAACDALFAKVEVQLQKGK